MKKACAALAGKRQQLAKLITSEMGKTLAESLEEVDDNVDMAAWKSNFCDLVAQANANPEGRRRLVDREAPPRRRRGLRALELSR